MERTDFIKTKDDIICNIMTLYSYLKGELGDEYKNWAIDKMVRGKNFVELLTRRFVLRQVGLLVTLIIRKINTMKIMAMEHKRMRK